TASSLKERGENAIPIERMMRDIRINRIIEGSSEIMRLFIAREALDPHVKLVMNLLKSKSLNKKLKAGLKMLSFYVKWYPSLWLPSFRTIQTGSLSSRNKKHLRFIRRTSRVMARSLFHKVMAYQMRLQDEQIILAHFVDIATLLFAMGASLARTEKALYKSGNPHELQELTDLFCKETRKEIKQHFKSLKTDNRNGIARISKNMLAGKYSWMENGILTPEEAMTYYEKQEMKMHNLGKEKVEESY
ncbi:MAG: hypothetical protein MI922_18440, partial [Bacteroidales bacterium]|nr:hypothetical protein [Bacteroidales bacterium]